MPLFCFCLFVCLFVTAFLKIQLFYIGPISTPHDGVNAGGTIYDLRTSACESPALPMCTYYEQSQTEILSARLQRAIQVFWTGITINIYV